MQTKQRKPIALLLAAMMVAGLFVSMPLTASAAGSTGDSGDEYSINIGLSDNEDDIRIKIRNFMFDHSVGAGDVVTITGMTGLRSQIPIEIYIPGGATMVWKARVGSNVHNTGVYLNLGGEYGDPGTFEVAEGGYIHHSGGGGCAINNVVGHDIIIQEGGEVSSYGGTAIVSNFGGDITVNGGLVKCDAGYGIVAMNTNHGVVLNGGKVESKYTSVFTDGDVFLTGGQVICHEREPIVAAHIIYSGGSGVAVGWNSTAGNTEYSIGSTGDIYMYGGSAKWWYMPEQGAGIAYQPEGSAEWSFLNVYGVTITKAEDSLLDAIKIEYGQLQFVKTRYVPGETLDLAGLSEITAVYDDGFEFPVQDFTTSPQSGDILSSLGTIPVTVSYTEDGITKTTTFDVTVYEPGLCYETGGMSYATLTDMLWNPAVCPDYVPTTIKLLDDVDCYEEINIDRKNILFDLNGHTLRLLKGFTSESSVIDYTGAGAFEVYNRAQFWGTSLKCTYFESDKRINYSGLQATGGSTVVINGNAKGSSQSKNGLILCQDSTVTINGNVTTDNDACFRVEGYSTPTSVTVNGSLSAANLDEWQSAIGVSGNGDFSVHGDVFVQFANPQPWCVAIGMMVNAADNKGHIGGNLSSNGKAAEIYVGTLHVEGNVTGPVNVFSGGSLIVGGNLYSDPGLEGGAGIASTPSGAGMMSASASIYSPDDAALCVYEGSASIGGSIEAGTDLGLFANDAAVTIGRSIRAGAGLGVWMENDSNILIKGSIYADNDVDGDGTGTIEVLDIVLTGIEVTDLPLRTIYNLDDPLDLTGLAVVATYGDGSTAKVNDYFTDPANGAVLNTAGTQAVTVLYSEDGVATTASFNVVVEGGAALTYTASIDPFTSHTFHSAMAGYDEQEPQVFTVSNTGTGTITSISAALHSGAAFEITAALSGTAVEPGETATVSVRPKTGLAAGYYTDTLNVTGDNGISLSVDLGFTVNAVPTYTLNVSAVGGGSVTGTASGSYYAGTPISVAAVPDSNCRFVGWSVTGATIAGGNTANPAAFSMPENEVTLTANFEADDDTVYVSLVYSGGYYRLYVRNAVDLQTLDLGIYINGIYQIDTFYGFMYRYDKDFQLDTLYRQTTPFNAAGLTQIGEFITDGVPKLGYVAATGVRGGDTVRINTVIEAGSLIVTEFVPVANIITVPEEARLGVPLTLDGLVIPMFATNSNIVWTVKNPGATNATITGGKLYAETDGLVTVTATIPNGKAAGVPYTQDFDILVKFTPVTQLAQTTNMVEVAGQPLEIRGNVIPPDATYQDITWSLKDPGKTGATLVNDILYTLHPGIAVLTATVKNGLAIGVDYVEDVNVTVMGFTPVTDITGIPTTLMAGAYALGGTVVPDYATKDEITWSVADPGTTGANITGGNILNTTGAGTAIVKATVIGGLSDAPVTDYTKDFPISVTVPFTLTGIAVTTPPAKTEYFIGDTLDLAGLAVTATYSDDSTMAVTGYTTDPASGTVLNAVGIHAVTVSYTEGGVTRTASFNVEVSAKPVTLTSIAVTTPPAKTEYFVGDTLDLAGLAVTATYSDDSTMAVTGYTTDPANGTTLNAVGIYTVTVSYTEGGVTRAASFDVEVSAKPIILTDIAVTTPPAKTEYFVGDTLDLADLAVTATYSDDSTKAVAGYTTDPASGTVLNAVGIHAVTVSYTEGGVTRTASFNVEVSAKPIILTDIAVTTPPAKTEYFVGDALDLAGLSVTATYSDDSTKAVAGYTTDPASGVVLATVGTQTVTVSYTEGGVTRTASFDVEVSVKPVTLAGIAVTTPPVKTEYFVGDALDLAGLAVTATYSDDSTKAVTGYTTDPANGATLTTVGTQTVTASYTEGGVTRAATFDVMVKAAENYVCEIDGTGFETLGEAFATLVDNAPTTIKLLVDIAYDELWVATNKDVTFDLNGKDLVFSIGILANNSSIGYVNGGNLKLNGGTGSLVNCTCAFTYVWADLLCYGCNVTVNGDIDISDHYTSYVSVSGGSVLTVNGNINAPCREIDCPAVYCNNSEILINGDVTAIGSEGYGVQVLNNGQVTINGTLTANEDNYIIFGASGSNYHCPPAGYQPTTSKPGYNEYAYSGSFVWIKAADVEYSIGFIGYYDYDFGGGPVKLNTSFYWQTVKAGEAIDWDAVFDAYADWESIGGYGLDGLQGWQTSGTFSHYYGETVPYIVIDEALKEAYLENFYGEIYFAPVTVVEKATITGVSNAKFISIVETYKNSRIWALTFDVTVTYSNGESEVMRFSINLNGNNANQNGKYTFGADHILNGYTLTYDIKGNGSNIKAFSIMVDEVS